ncbi:MAG TPA: type II toxin-antitoxin system HicA family toxin [Candidatus Limnocylindrales bacterium]|nr:type II toxin-antitoxin system HicA family toxin [Candidatus Limnocylindrales bacterium]
MPAIKPIHHKKLVEFFEKSGWKYERTKGDHIIFTKKGYLRPVVIPMYKTIPVFIIKNNLRTAKISNEEYFKGLKLN